MTSPAPRIAPATRTRVEPLHYVTLADIALNRSHGFPAHALCGEWLNDIEDSDTGPVGGTRQICRRCAAIYANLPGGAA